MRYVRHSYCLELDTCNAGNVNNLHSYGHIHITLLKWDYSKFINKPHIKHN